MTYSWINAHGARCFELPCSQESNTTHPTPPMTKPQIALLKKMRAVPLKRRPRTPPRGVHKKARMKITQSPKGIEARRKLVKQALLECYRVKCAEKRNVVPGKRRRREVNAKDVKAWLSVKKHGNFCINTLTADIRVVRKQTL